jgi:hypothetical protein
MAGMGPAPKDPEKRARRNATIATTKLPGEGRKGAAPKWPLPPDPRATAQLEVGQARAAELRDQWAAAEDSGEARRLAKQLEQVELAVRTQELIVAQRYDMELAVWRELWRSPQAVQWERQDSGRSVAMYVRHQVLGELGSLDHSREARLRAKDLGLTPMSMKQLGWSVASDEVAAQREQRSPATGSRGRRGPLRSVEEPPKAAGDD